MNLQSAEDWHETCAAGAAAADSRGSSYIFSICDQTRHNAAAAAASARRAAERRSVAVERCKRLVLRGRTRTRGRASMRLPFGRPVPAATRHQHHVQFASHHQCCD